MDSIERAIRDALGKGDARDRAFRERVYRSVLAALERANASNVNLTAEAIANRKNVLKQHIIEIEQEHMLALAPAVETPQRSAASSSSPSPEISASRSDTAPLSQMERAEHLGAIAEDRLSPLEDTVQARRRPYAAMFIVVTVLAVLAIGGWWAYQTGLFGRPDTSVPNPVPILEEEDFTPATPPPLGEVDTSAPRNWVTIFTPADPSGVAAPSGANAKVMEDDSGIFLRIRSGGTGQAIVFDVSSELLANLAGAGVVFDIVARTEEGKQTQMSVTCNFGELGDCGRKRYIVGYEQADYLFEIDLPRGNPGANGTMAIVPDVANTGRALDVFEIRVAAR